jgi:tetratricopeptide (TPR) repeat protein
MQIYERLGDYAAVEANRHILEKNTDQDFTEKLEEAANLTAAGRYDQANQLLLMIMGQTKRHPLAHLQLGKLRLEQGELVEAITHYEHGLSFIGHPDAYTDIILACLANGRMRDASVFVSAMLDNFPIDGESHRGAALYLHTLQSWVDCLRELEIVQVIGHKKLLDLRIAVDCHRQLGDSTNTLTSLRELADHLGELPEEFANEYENLIFERQAVA